MALSPGGHPTELALRCARCGLYFLWKYGRAITPAALRRRPLFCPACRKLIAQHRIDV